RILLGPFAGVLADRYNRKRLLIVTDVAAGMACGIIAVPLGLGTALPPVELLYGTVIVVAASSTVFDAAAGAHFPAVVRETEFADAEIVSRRRDFLLSVMVPPLAALLAVAAPGVAF